MDSETNGLTHDEIWDDSAMVNSWNEALEEYKKYHSIHARGERIQTRSSRDAKTETDEGGEGTRASGLGDTTETITGVEGTDESLEQMPDTDTKSVPPTSTATGHQGSGEMAAGFTAPPQAVLGSVRDEGLKKLLMSWYYAGYYTGLYEGQQQQKGQQQQQQQ